MKKSPLEEVKQLLRENADQHTRETGQRFFKEEIKLYGVKTAVVTKLARSFLDSIKSMEREEVFVLCEELWRSGYLEESFIACKWAYSRHADFLPEDFAVFERWVNFYVSNWASCDTLCNHTVGTFIEMYPDHLGNLKGWAKSENRWVRRASAVSLIVPAREGKFLKEILEIANILLLDEDDLVQKGYGWMLKAASEVHQGEIFDFVMQRKAEMPRTALRYAIEKMPKDLKERAMAKE